MKDELRKQLKARKRGLADSFITTASEAIGRRCVGNLAGRKVSRAHIYLANSAWREVDTAPLITALKSTYPGIIIVNPAQESDAPPPNDQFDVVIVPTLGFDDACNRIGLGVGWYDRFLAFQPQALKIGLAFEVSRVENIPQEPHDIQLDFVVTERAIYAPDSHGKSA